ncbi:Cyclin-dependent kinase inhibitor [Oesophagostomum dentatum]|uniref:Cyclin-dependent kinase inhibitor n=1 Tax=Oesophagostomum dentatum TaxID=61180 RepID=A0A0B1SNX4_OESDE|nr:Cyclin-dependent kinase inhibitor [Oesophagostomum dentatum]
MENSSPGKKQRIKRCLFGRPDQQEVEKWLDDSSKKQLRQSKEKWGFDFELDVPVRGDVEYEVVPANKVPSLYKSCAVGKKKNRQVSEFDPNIPSASVVDEKLDEELNNHRPLTRSCTKQQDNTDSQNRRNLKQAKLTNVAHLAAVFFRFFKSEKQGC